MAPSAAVDYNASILSQGWVKRLSNWHFECQLGTGEGSLGACFHKGYNVLPGHERLGAV